MTFAGVWSEATHPKDYPARQYTTVLVSEILTTGRHQLHEALLSTLWHIALAVVLAQWILTRLVIRVPPRLRLCESLVAQSQLHHLAVRPVVECEKSASLDTREVFRTK